MAKVKTYWVDNSRDGLYSALKALETIGTKATSQAHEKDCETLNQAKSVLNRRLAEIFSKNA